MYKEGQLCSGRLATSKAMAQCKDTLNHAYRKSIAEQTVVHVIWQL